MFSATGFNSERDIIENWKLHSNEDLWFVVVFNTLIATHLSFTLRVGQIDSGDTWYTDKIYPLSSGPGYRDHGPSCKFHMAVVSALINVQSVQKS